MFVDYKDIHANFIIFSKEHMKTMHLKLQYIKITVFMVMLICICANNDNQGVTKKE